MMCGILAKCIISYIMLGVLLALAGRCLYRHRILIKKAFIPFMQGHIITCLKFIFFFKAAAGKGMIPAFRHLLCQALCQVIYEPLWKAVPA